jgi:hypothetical protein
VLLAGGKVLNVLRTGNIARKAKRGCAGPSAVL